MKHKPTRNCIVCGKRCYGHYCIDCFTSNKYRESQRKSNNKHRALRR